MFDLLNIDDVTRNLYQVKNPNINISEEELLKQKDGLFSTAIFGDRFSDSWYLNLAYIQLNVYMPKFPIFQIIRSDDTIKKFKSNPDFYLDLEKVDIVKKKTENSIQFNQLLTKQGWKLFIEALINKKSESKSVQLLKQYLNRYGIDMLLTDKILVLPPGFRDYRIGDDSRVMHNQLSDIYATLIAQNAMYDNTPQRAILLFKTYDTLFTYLIKKFSSKEGILRNMLASKIVNTAVRSVIIPNDNLGLDEIAIPFKSLLLMYAAEIIHYILTKYREEWLELVSTAKESKLGANVNDILKVIKKLSKGYDIPKPVYDFFRKVLENDILPNAVVIYKRDPALHKSSFLAARPRIAQQDAIEINTAVCAPLGGDFDGDSVIGNVNIKVIRKSDNKTVIYRDVPFENLPLLIFRDDLDNNNSNETETTNIS